MEAEARDERVRGVAGDEEGGVVFELGDEQWEADVGGDLGVVGVVDGGGGRGRGGEECGGDLWVGGRLGVGWMDCMGGGGETVGWGGGGGGVRWGS